MISGHTYGGQYIPFNFMVRLEHLFVQGVYRHNRSMIYVSPGMGYWGPSLGEITVFTFV
jgi:uncharacterized protein